MSKERNPLNSNTTNTIHSTTVEELETFSANTTPKTTQAWTGITFNNSFDDIAWPLKHKIVDPENWGPRNWPHNCEPICKVTRSLPDKAFQQFRRILYASDLQSTHLVILRRIWSRIVYSDVLPTGLSVPISVYAVAIKQVNKNNPFVLLYYRYEQATFYSPSCVNNGNNSFIFDKTSCDFC